MTQFNINFSQTKSVAQEIKKRANELESIRNDLEQIMNQIKRDSSVGKYMQGADAGIASLDNLRSRTHKYADALEKIVSLYENTENRIKDRGIEQTDQINSTANNGSLGGNGSYSAKRTYEDWGVSGGSIRTVEYAYLSKFCNDVSNCSSTAEMEKKFKELIAENFPEDHPLRNMKIKAYKEGTNRDMDAIVIEVDSDHAIVVFGGTSGLSDGLTDFGLVADSTPGLQEISAINHAINPIEYLSENQFEAANKLISNLPYKDIKVTGHSLGGHLAADVTLNNKNVSLCTTFDPPGRGDTWMRTTFDSDSRVSKITNYCINGSPVNLVGDQIGKTYYKDVEENYDSFFKNHDIGYIIEAFGGQEELLAPDEV